MAKFSTKGLPPRQLDELLVGLCRALASVRGPREAAQLLADLLGPQELTMVAKRLRIAKLLLAGKTYHEIQAAVQAAPTTVARIQYWLQRSGAGYRLVVQRTKGSKAAGRMDVAAIRTSDGLLDSLERRLPLSMWPERLLRTIVRGASATHKRQLRGVLLALAQGKRKPALYRQLERLL